jgi:hypothetical protein
MTGKIRFRVGRIWGDEGGLGRGRNWERPTAELGEKFPAASSCGERYRRPGRGKEGKRFVGRFLTRSLLGFANSSSVFSLVFNISPVYLSFLCISFFLLETYML